MDKPFGKKIFIFDDDFCQVLPVISHASYAVAILASLCWSIIWKHLKIMKLIINIRLHQSYNVQNNLKQINFTEFLLKIGDSKYSNIASIENMIELSSNIVLSKRNLKILIDFVYFNLIENSTNTNYFISKAILSPKNIHIDEISDIIMQKFSGEIYLYSNINSIDSADNSNSD